MSETLELSGVLVRPSFAEAFPMRATRLLITAESESWAETAARTATGFATSVIACGCEAGIERRLAPHETPDERPGVAVLFFATSEERLADQLVKRVGQCVLTCPTAAAWSGLDAERTLPLGRSLRFFGDGYQTSKRIGSRRFWRIPVMEGEFLVEDRVGVTKGVGGGNFLLLAERPEAALRAAEAAVAAIARVPNVILPFPGGIVRSGSKVGSRYKGLAASTNHRYCPTLRGLLADSALPPEVGSVLEIVIDGLDEASVARAMVEGIRAACALGRASGLVAVDAGNYGGALGPYHFHLHQLLAAATPPAAP
ncbi:MAG: formylmethanofuran--tetrahydromethanopterin N-formyltransferase [Geminicoccaceae bacterium]|nr:formylmethanofuran--tetrahydromethanopterin N-formyltransferase [Geminicoccaceae bacterium]MDW8444016.1 formylmethanofuran--tetrahydromethanopterin N-formyltransferase [Acetobacteraceae bacterium]MCS7268141.1 formylmethanofuran--tetrahydromethanopterin N-formyltransferase [Geminicoccaceae bacterium]MCX7629621.1 formylmethanofuran--tetrahydromethanopterin N-formyltransferase [Geminicoccaceae bacterium]MDW8125394.1 formylmethanofuran--tetrahydromethanopterin N-formyltransferase [Geminicoccacea